MKEFIALLPLVLISAIGCFAFGFAICLFFKCLPKCVKEKGSDKRSLSCRCKSNPGCNPMYP